MRWHRLKQKHSKVGRRSRAVVEGEGPGGLVSAQALPLASPLASLWCPEEWEGEERDGERPRSKDTWFWRIEEK